MQTFLKRLFYFLLLGKQNNRRRLRRTRRNLNSQGEVQTVSGTSSGNKNILLHFISIRKLFSKSFKTVNNTSCIYRVSDNYRRSSCVQVE